MGPLQASGRKAPGPDLSLKMEGHGANLKRTKMKADCLGDHV